MVKDEMRDSIPKFDDFLMPILRFSKDEKEHDLGETIEEMSKEFSLNNNQRNLLMTNGKRTYIYDRTAWAVTYLVQAGLLVRTKRSHYKISKLGLKELPNMPPKINYKDLERYNSFYEFRYTRGHKQNKPSSDNKSLNDYPTLTPDEEIESMFENRNKFLANELLETLASVKPSDFERIVIDLVLALGYGKDHEEMAKAIGGSGDGGVDGEIPQDKLGLEKIYLQAKRYQKDETIGPEKIRGFSGALSGKQAKKGIFLTTAKFTKPARNAAENDKEHRIVLIDGTELTELMVEYKVGVKEIKPYSLKELDKDYFESF